MFQQQFERRLVKGRVFWLEHEIVFRGRKQEFNKRSCERICREAMAHNLIEIGSPASKIIVSVDARHMSRSSALLQRRDIRSDLARLRKEFVSARKLEIVDHIDQ